MQYGTIRIGQVIKLMVDSFGEDALLDSLKENERDSWHRKINRLISEKDIRIDSVREFEFLFNGYLQKAKEKGYIQQVHIGMIQTLYWNLQALVTETTPYSAPTQNEVELQIMWCIADLFHECMEAGKRNNNLTKDVMDVTVFSLFDYWVIDNYEKEVCLINNTFRILFSDLQSGYSHNKLYKIWDDKKAELDGARGEYSKSVHDWISENKAPKWKMLKPILESQLKSTSNTEQGIYYRFKFQLFAACFMNRFIKSLTDQKLITDSFIPVVQKGFLSFYHYLFIEKSFKYLQPADTINFMFMCLRGLCIPTTNAPVSDLIREAFSKEDVRHPDFHILQKIAFVDSELAIYPEYEKFVKQKEFDSSSLEFLSKDSIGECSDFFYNWFKGRACVLLNKVEEGFVYYQKAYDYKYFGGQFLSGFLTEILAVMQKLKLRKPELNIIVDFAHAIQYSIDQDNKQYAKLNRNIDSDFDLVFPAEARFQET